ncbi:uncharacterized protein LOC127801525 [Diospyros lotus]|uniref:uncharacterized protein LOC127801525 n=1 Tax=Diospyros lotus TaxID=55363 RepID=UPI00224E5A57|nr:uncharacterized protein LOC127801525 [Diospyros lotus]
MWQQPCIVFCSHWSLRLGPVVYLLRRWSGDQNSLLVMEKGVDADLALLPFKPMAMKILQCSFLCGMRMQKVQPLLKMLQPKLVLFPENLRRCFEFSCTTLQKMGINASVEQGSNNSKSEYKVHVEPNKALIEVEAGRTVISSTDEKLAASIFGAIASCLEGI